MNKYVLAFIMLLTLISSGCSLPNDTNTSSPNIPPKPSQMANPASVYCTEHGGRLEIVTDASGWQTGRCTLADGTVCDEWAYFRGECPKQLAQETTTYKSSLGFSLALPGFCSDQTIINEWQSPQYVALENLDITNTNGDKQIQCFIPSQESPEEIVGLLIHQYPCDQVGEPTTIGSRTFMITETPAWLGLDEGKWCVNIPLSSGSINLSFTQKAYLEAIIYSLVIE